MLALHSFNHQCFFTQEVCYSKQINSVEHNYYINISSYLKNVSFYYSNLNCVSKLNLNCYK